MVDVVWKGYIRGARLEGGLDVCLLVVEHTRNAVSDMAAVGV